MNTELQQLINEAFELKKYSLAQLISLYENQTTKAEKKRTLVSNHLKRQYKPKAKIIGSTGPPGAGKSTLLNRLAQNIIDDDEEKSVAIVAIDPSSHRSGGSILGDRTRTNFASTEKRVFFRSQATDLELGGLSKSTFQVVSLLRYFFDYIFIETVGIGQNEVEIHYLADKIFMVMQPFSGDQIQFIKSGIMEVPNFFIMNKCDEENLAKKSYFQLKTSLNFISNIEEEKAPQIFLTSALNNIGIDEVRDTIKEINSENSDYNEEYFYQKALRAAFGSLGQEILESNKVLFDSTKSFDENLSLAQKTVHHYVNFNSQETE